MKKKTASKETVESPAVKNNLPDQRRDDDRSNFLHQHHRDCISACARAALRLAEVVQEVFQARANVAQMVRVTMDQVVEACSKVVSGELIPSERSLHLSAEACQVASSDTRATRIVLRLFQEQVLALDESYLQAKGSDPIVAFRALREVTREFSDPPDAAAGWQYVLRAWDTLDPEAVRIARWFPVKGAREVLKFDEATRTWRHVVSDESTAAEASVEVKSTFAVAK